MARLWRRSIDMGITSSQKVGRRSRSTLFFFIMFMVLFMPCALQGQERGKVAVLPFRIHAMESLDYLKTGLQEMFTARMAEMGYSLVDPAIINRHPLVLQQHYEKEDVRVLGEDLQADWVITGSLTQIGKKISIDIKIFDVHMTKSPFTIFIVADDIDRLPDTVERAVTSIDNKISGVTQVNSIRVAGNRRIESDAILAVVETKKGDRFDQNRLDKDLRAIFKMGYFKDVNIEVEDGTNGKNVTFKVVEKPSISSISFEGNKKIKDKTLIEEIGIKRYSILNMSQVKQSINRLEEYYRQKGFYNIRINEKIQERPNNEVALIYLIDEGEKISITKIQFIGNAIFKDSELKDIMETSEKGFFSWITKSGVLDRKKLEFDIQKIVSFYHNRGYIRARAGEPEVTYQEGDGLTITIEIIEGHQYKVNTVEIKGDLIKPLGVLMDRIRINKEEYFDREVLRQDILMLKEMYADEGYAYAEVIPVTKEDDKAFTVDITYDISKRKRVRFERINITGNQITRDKVIRRELKVVEGEFFSGTNLEKSTRNLRRLGFFEDIKLRPRQGSREDLMILDVDVKERPTGTFSVGMGYSSFDDVIGMMQVSMENFLGKGQRLAGQAALGGRTTQFNISFTEPWLLDRPLSTTIDLYNWKTEYDTYTKDSIGGALKVGFPLNLDDYTTGSIKYIYDDADVTDISDRAAAIIKDMAGKNVTSSITLGIERDSRNDIWNTSEGSVNSLTFEYAGGVFGGDSYYTKYTARSAWYFPMWWDTVFMIQGRAGYVTERSGGKLPIYERFTLGGINSVRGYDYASIGPKDPVTGDVIGGEKMWIYNLEYRFPLYKQVGLVGLVFFDAGNAFTKEEPLKFRGRRSVGVGVRWYSPIGPLRLEYGWKLDQEPGEKIGAYEFSIGGLF